MPFNQGYKPGKPWNNWIKYNKRLLFKHSKIQTIQTIGKNQLTNFDLFTFYLILLYQLTNSKSL